MDVLGLTGSRFLEVCTVKTQTEYGLRCFEPATRAIDLGLWAPAWELDAHHRERAEDERIEEELDDDG